MKKLEIIESDRVIAAFGEEARSPTDRRYQHRLQGVALIVAGYSSAKVSELLGEDRRTVQRWIRRCNDDGPDGLRDYEGASQGRSSLVDVVGWRAISDDFSHAPRDFGYVKGRRNLRWTVGLLAEHLQSRYGIALSLRQCQRIFLRLSNEARIPQK